MIRVTPPLPRFAYVVCLPEDWTQLPLPDEPPNFDDPNAFMPAGIFQSPPGNIVLSVACRPAYDDGTLDEWLRWICDAHRFDLQASRMGRLNGRRVCFGEALQPAEGGKTLRMKMVVVDAERRLFVASIMCNTDAYSVHEVCMEKTLQSFQPATIQDDEAPESAPSAADWKRFAANETATSYLASKHPEDPDADFGQPLALVRVEDNAATLDAQKTKLTLKAPLGWYAFEDDHRIALLEPTMAVQCVITYGEETDDMHIAMRGLSVSDALDQLIESKMRQNPDAEMRLLPFPSGKGFEMRGMANEPQRHALSAFIQKRHGMVFITAGCHESDAANTYELMRLLAFGISDDRVAEFGIPL